MLCHPLETDMQQQLLEMCLSDVYLHGQSTSVQLPRLSFQGPAINMMPQADRQTSRQAGARTCPGSVEVMKVSRADKLPRDESPK
jgi:hypothetical protein